MNDPLSELHHHLKFLIASVMKLRRKISEAENNQDTTPQTLAFLRNELSQTIKQIFQLKSQIEESIAAQKQKESVSAQKQKELLDIQRQKELTLFIQRQEFEILERIEQLRESAAEIQYKIKQIENQETTPQTLASLRLELSEIRLKIKQLINQNPTIIQRQETELEMNSNASVSVSDSDSDSEEIRSDVIDYFARLISAREGQPIQEDQPIDAITIARAKLLTQVYAPMALVMMLLLNQRYLRKLIIYNARKR